MISNVPVALLGVWSCGGGGCLGLGKVRGGGGGERGMKRGGRKKIWKDDLSQ